MNEHIERRRAPRSLHETPITTKVLSSTSPSIAAGHTFESSSSDISNHGICLRVNTPVHAGTDLEMWIISSHHKETLVISGTVRWCLPLPSDPTIHQIGVELSQIQSGDFHKWQQMAADLGSTRA